MFGLSPEKLLIIGVIAVFLLGPERLPLYASKLAKLTRSLRDMANGAKERMREELGPDFDDTDWKKLDPRQYDPRRIIRDALLDDDEPVWNATGAAAGAPVAAPTIVGEASGDDAARQTTAAPVAQIVLEPGTVPPFDGEAT